jgi:hypothetical protein
MAPHRWVLEARKPEADSEGQVHKHTDEPGPDEPENDEAEDTEGQGFRLPNAKSRSRGSSAQKSRPA